MIERLQRVFLRAGFVLLLIVIGAYIRPLTTSTIANFAVGAGIGVLVVAVQPLLGKPPLRTVLCAALGMLVGALLGAVLVFALPAGSALLLFFRAVVPLAGAYLGLTVGVVQARSVDLPVLGMVSPRPRSGAVPKLLDSSVLVDGRIVDIIRSHFLEGTLVVPEFVLHELQLIADSPDSARRNRGRRGLDVVRQLQNTPGVRVEVDSRDFPAVREVDLKLIELAKVSKATVVTNDFNLNKLAQVQGVPVLNINELANALKPVVLPGEIMRVSILKEGKEHNQGIAYLDDGTMVVVDNARRQISKTINVVITSVLQTSAGKMIFGKYEDRPHGANDNGSAAGHT